MHLLLLLVGAAHAAELDFTLITASCSATAWFGSTCLDYTVGGGADTVGVCTYDDADDAPTDLAAVIDGSETFGIVLSDADNGEAPALGGAVVRDPGSGVVVLAAEGCSATFTPATAE
jgi:hypothetical protein